MRKYLNIHPTNRVTSEQIRFERSKWQRMERIHQLHQMMLQITDFINRYITADVEYPRHWVGGMLPCATWTPYHSTAVVELSNCYKLKVVYSYVDPKDPKIHIEVLSENNQVLGYTATYTAHAIYNVMCQAMKQDLVDTFDAVFDMFEAVGV